jgi:hypothetical protein
VRKNADSNQPGCGLLVGAAHPCKISRTLPKLGLTCGMHLRSPQKKKQQQQKKKKNKERSM